MSLRSHPDCRAAAVRLSRAQNLEQNRHGVFAMAAKVAGAATGELDCHSGTDPAGADADIHDVGGVLGALYRQPTYRSELMDGEDTNPFQRPRVILYSIGRL